MFVLFQFLVMFALVVVGFGLTAITGGGTSENPGPAATAVNGLVGILFIIFILGSMIPSLSVAVRRLHDSEKSGWFLLLAFVPFGSLVLLIFYCLDGTPGPNRFGPDPKGRGGARTADVFN